MIDTQKRLSLICSNVQIDYEIGFTLEQEYRCLIAPMALAQPLHPISSSSRNTS